MAAKRRYIIGATLVLGILVATYFFGERGDFQAAVIGIAGGLIIVPFVMLSKWRRRGRINSPDQH